MGNRAKILHTRFKEFLLIWRNYSFIYAFYGIIWWFCFYFKPPFCYKLSTYAIKKKTVWLDKYIESRYKNIIDRHKENNCICNNVTINKEPYIWVFWGQGEGYMPPLVKACHRQLTYYNKNVVLLTNENIETYISIPPEVYNKTKTGKISWAYFSDIVRNTLLAKHGGLWIDATVWVPQRIPMEILKKYSFFSPSEEFVPNNRTIRFWSNLEWNWNGWCLWSSKTNYPIFSFVADMLTEIAIKEPIIPDYVTIDYLIYYAIRLFPGKQKDFKLAKGFECNNRHKLATIMNEEFNEDRYQELTKDNYFFKLSYRANWKEKNEENKPTFYGRILKNII